MKALILAALLGLSAPAAAVDWKEHPYDKAAHIAIGGAISCAITSKTKEPWMGVLLAFAVGTMKELTDKNADMGDLASWGVGGALGTLCLEF